MTELLLGIACGVALALFFSFGAAFFQQLQTSIQYGFRRSVPFAFGVSAGDIIVVFLMLTVLKNADMYELLHNVYVASIGGGVLALMGIHTFRKKAEVRSNTNEQMIKFKNQGDVPRMRTVFLQGFIINFLNPLIWIYWVSVIALLSGELDIPTNQMYLFFFGVLATTLGIDVLKCKLASLLHQVITARVLNIFNKSTGLIMFGFAAYLVISMIVYQVNPAAREKEQQQQPTSTEMIKKLHTGLQHTDSSTVQHSEADGR